MIKSVCATQREREIERMCVTQRKSKSKERYIEIMCVAQKERQTKMVCINYRLNFLLAIGNQFIITF